MMVCSDTGKPCNQAQESLTHSHGGATGNHLIAVIGKSILPPEQKKAVSDVWYDFMISVADINPKEGQIHLLEELSKTLFESYRDYRTKFKSLA